MLLSRQQFRELSLHIFAAILNPEETVGGKWYKYDKMIGFALFTRER